MAISQQNARIGNRYPALQTNLASSIFVNQHLFSATDINTWKLAIDRARNVRNPLRRTLLELYDNIIIDGQIQAVMNKREIAVTNKRVLFLDKGGKENEYVKDEITDMPWFRQILKHGVESVAYGHSLIELVSEEGKIKRVELINRANVRPEFGVVMVNYADYSNVIDFRNDPEYNYNLIEFGNAKDLGLLMTAAQYVIYKRGGFGDWAQFAELFGMPLRVFYYDKYDDASRNTLKNVAETTGGSGYVILPDGTRVEFVQNTASGQNTTFKDIIETANSEISKTFLGNTMTTDNGSSHSQSETHKEVEEEINLSDLISIEYQLNYQLKDKLKNFDYAMPEGRFCFEETQKIPKDKLIEIALKVATKVKIDPKYWYETFGIPAPDSGPAYADPIPAPPVNEPPVKKKKLKRSADCGCGTKVNLSYSGSMFPSETELINAIYNKNGTKLDYNTFKINATKLAQGVSSGFGKVEYGTEPEFAKNMMDANVYRFGWDKNQAQIFELNNALKASKSFEEFKQNANDILGSFNHSFLETEYNFAVAASQNAAAWLQAKEEQDTFPYLHYQTVGDSRVRNAHRALDGMVFKVSDNSWQSIYPPNGYNCRCEMIKLSDYSGTPQNGKDAINALGEEYKRMQDGGFAINRGETKEVFTANEFYLKKLNKTTEDINYKTLKLAPYNEQAIVKQNLPGSSEYNLFMSKSVNIKDNNYHLINDAIGRTIGVKAISKPTIQDFSLLKLSLTKASEIWLQANNQYRYVCFLKGSILITDVSFAAGNLEVLSTYKTTNDELRTGILIYKK